MNYEVTHIHKVPRLDAHHRISWVGSIGNGQSGDWKLTSKEAAEALLRGDFKLFVRASGKGLLGKGIINTAIGGSQIVQVIPVGGGLLGGEPFVKTESDGVETNNLLDLDELPAWVTHRSPLQV